MARYKRIDTSPRFLPVVLSEQPLPDTFEHALNHLLDLFGLDARFCNDATGAPAYPPAALLKLIPFAYSRETSRSVRYIYPLSPITCAAVGASAKA